MFHFNQAASILNATDNKVNPPIGYTSIRYMSDMIRKRRFQQIIQIQPSVVFFRSKLSHPLSPKTPALIIDMIIKGCEDDFDDIEKSLHVSLYDLTYRHDLESCWIDRLKVLFHVDNNFESQERKQEHRNENSIVTNVSL